MSMMEFYETDERFKKYVDAYCVDRNVTVEVALTHALVREVYEMYKSGGV